MSSQDKFASRRNNQTKSQQKQHRIVVLPLFDMAPINLPAKTRSSVGIENGGAKGLPRHFP